nr:proline-rich protein 36-like [Penaeus vannamei]
MAAGVRLPGTTWWYQEGVITAPNQEEQKAILTPLPYNTGFIYALHVNPSDTWCDRYQRTQPPGPRPTPPAPQPPATSTPTLPQEAGRRHSGMPVPNPEGHGRLALLRATPSPPQTLLTCLLPKARARTAYPHRIELVLRLPQVRIYGFGRIRCSAAASSSSSAPAPAAPPPCPSPRVPCSAGVAAPFPELSLVKPIPPRMSLRVHAHSLSVLSAPPRHMTPGRGTKPITYSRLEHIRLPTKAAEPTFGKITQLHGVTSPELAGVPTNHLHTTTLSAIRPTSRSLCGRSLLFP